jgi:hypothetical protein
MPPSRAKSNPLDFMHQVSRDTFLHQPSTTTHDASAPKLIVLFTWMGAQDSHIIKYVNNFLALYPSSPLLLARFPLHYSFSNHKCRREMKHVLSIIQTVFGPTKNDAASLCHSASESETDLEMHTDKPRSGLLFHVMSNGGAISFRHLVDVATRLGITLPPHAMVLDSTPGKFHWSDTHEAFAALLPKWFSPAVHPLMALAMLMNVILVQEAVPQTEMFKALNDEGAIKTQVRRTYLLSGADRIIAAEDVREHSETAQEKGLAVQIEDFGHSKHVQHMKSDPERYWAVVKETFEAV